MKKFLDKIKAGKDGITSGSGDSISIKGIGGSGGSGYSGGSGGYLGDVYFNKIKPISYPKSYPDTYPRYDGKKLEEWTDSTELGSYENYEKYGLIGFTLEDAGCSYSAFQTMECGLILDANEYKKDSELYAKAHFNHHGEKHDKKGQIYKIKNGLCVGCVVIKLINFINEYNTTKENCEIKYKDAYILQLECGMVVPSMLHTADFRQIELIHSDVHDFEINERFFMPQQVESIIKRYKEAEKSSNIRKIII